MIGEKKHEKKQKKCKESKVWKKRKGVLRKMAKRKYKYKKVHVKAHHKKGYKHHGVKVTAHHVKGHMRMVKTTMFGRKRDAKLRAKAVGKRRSASGNIYYEYRSNRSDANRKRRPYL